MQNICELIIHSIFASVSTIRTFVNSLFILFLLLCQQSAEWNITSDRYWCCDPRTKGIVCNDDNRITNIDLKRFDNNKIGLGLDIFSNMVMLETLTFIRNSMVGTLRPLNYLHRLKTLDLTANRIVGDLSFLSNMTSLTSIKLGDNALSGNLTHVSSLRALTCLDVRKNLLIDGELTHLSSLVNMQILDLGWNQLTGSLQPLSYMGGLTSVSIRSNKMHGTLEPLRKLVYLNFLILSNNSLSCIFHIANLSRLIVLDVADNQFEEEIISLSSLTLLDTLILSNNRFNGTIDNLYGLKKLVTL